MIMIDRVKLKAALRFVADVKDVRYALQGV